MLRPGAAAGAPGQDGPGHANDNNKTDNNTNNDTTTTNNE